MLDQSRSRRSPVIRHPTIWLAAAVGLTLVAAEFGSTGPQSLAAPPRPSRIRRERPKTELPTARPPRWDEATIGVFFADAKQHLGPGEPRVGGAATVAIKPGTPPAAQPAVAASAHGNAVSWSQVISRDTLEDEIKHLSTELNRAVNSAGGFKSGGFRQARVHLTVLAALFEVIASYDADVRWKSAAAGWAELFGRAGRNCQAGSDAALKEAKLRAADLSELIRGNEATPEGGAQTTTVAERIDRRPLMSRLELSQQERLGPWTANAAAFDQHVEALRHEAELLAAIAELIQRDGYEFADDDAYLGYAQELQRQAKNLGDSISGKDYPQAEKAANGIRQSCEKCHADFRG